ncbi:hypothetical protein CCACVL1_08149 [Corchorus capsularis]|uniref:Uncharacterized protein n=1 Tax=Corchorus capsularis TaxID=210143 RepID=A0A1R3J214_COCAP|nr:hypothetical protein CCACVL1_08149 [Corchorus capsularis]
MVAVKIVIQPQRDSDHPKSLQRKERRTQLHNLALHRHQIPPKAGPLRKPAPVAPSPGTMCGTYGHVRESPVCPLKEKPQSNPTPAELEGGKDKDLVKESKKLEPTTNPNVGPWMIVQRKKGGSPSNKGQAKNTSPPLEKASGSSLASTSKNPLKNSKSKTSSPSPKPDPPFVLNFDIPSSFSNHTSNSLSTPPPQPPPLPDPDPLPPEDEPFGETAAKCNLNDMDESMLGTVGSNLPSKDVQTLCSEIQVESVNTATDSGGTDGNSASSNAQSDGAEDMEGVSGLHKC